MGRQRKAKVVPFKDLVRERDGHKCTECGITAKRYKKVTGRKLDVHRVVPGSEYTMEGCVTVCKGCHDRIHSVIGKSVQKYTSGKLQVLLTPELVKKIRIHCAMYGLRQNKFIAELIENAVSNDIDDLINDRVPQIIEAARAAEEAAAV